MANAFGRLDRLVPVAVPEAVPEAALAVQVMSRARQSAQLPRLSPSPATARPLHPPPSRQSGVWLVVLEALEARRNRLSLQAPTPRSSRAVRS